jgi:hypothetical protein
MDYHEMRKPFEPEIVKAILLAESPPQCRSRRTLALLHLAEFQLDRRPPSEDNRTWRGGEQNGANDRNRARGS